MPEPIDQRWVGERLAFELRDRPGQGLLPREHITDGLLTRRVLILHGRGFQGLDTTLPLHKIRKVSQHLFPQLTLELHTDRGQIDVPAGAHDLEALRELSARIEEGIARARRAQDPSALPEADRAALDELLGGRDR